MPDGSLTEKKFTDDLKLKTIKDYVTPEMYGAKGDGVTDDTLALQRCIDENPVVRLEGTYLVTDTITVNKELTENPFIVYVGKKIYGNGTIVISVDKNCLELYGRANKIDGITIRYDWSMVDDESNRYKHSLLCLVSPVHDVWVSYPCCDNTITDVNIMAGTVMYSEYEYLYATGIELKTEGTGYCYNNVFDNCSCYGMGTCIKASRSADSPGINANIFNVSSWCCECYAEGKFGGSQFRGNCQSKIVNYHGHLFRNFVGECNVIETFFYDVRDDDYLDRQSVINDATTKMNTFTNHISPESVENYIGNNTYCFKDVYSKPTFLTNGYICFSPNFTRIAPFKNALPECVTAATIITVDGEGDKSAEVIWADANNYPTYSYANKTLDDCKYLCGDSVYERTIVVGVPSGAERGYCALQIDIEKNHYVDFLSLECGGSNVEPRITSAKLQQVDDDGSVLAESDLLIIQTDKYNTVRGFVNNTNFGAFNANATRIIIKMELTDSIYFNRLSGVCRHNSWGSY